MKEIINTSSNGKWEHESQILEMAKRFNSKRTKIVFMDSQEEKRSTDQNAGLWRWDNFLGSEVGNTAKDQHYIMCGEIFGWTQKEIDGKTVYIPKRTTSNLTKAEWQDYLRDYRIKARENYDVEMPPFSYEDGE